jgi:hypothetical protein
VTYLKIDPVVLTTVGGYPAEIYGIDPGSSDCLIGKLNTPHGGTAMWNIRGMCRDHSHECNFDVRTDDFAEIERVARALVKEDYL